MLYIIKTYRYQHVFSKKRGKGQFFSGARNPVATVKGHRRRPSRSGKPADSLDSSTQPGAGAHQSRWGILLSESQTAFTAIQTLGGTLATEVETGTACIPEKRRKPDSFFLEYPLRDGRVSAGVR
jgi:hypothetical protein